MTREEEIRAEALNYSRDDNFVMGYNRVLDEAFTDGAKWADKHPDLSALWHDASEEPQGKGWKILCQDENRICWFDSGTNAFFTDRGWEDYVGESEIVRWAYVSDLLPKGGKE